MSALLDLQRSFQAYVLGEVASAPAAVTGTRAASAEERLHVYAEGIRLRFVEVLGEDYPGLRGLLGDEAFDGLGRAYAEAHPSGHPSIRWFGRHVAAFVRSTPPWCEHPVLADMAAFEWAKGELIDAADCAVVGVADIAAISPEDWAGIRPRLAPAVRRIALEWNAPALWVSIDADETPDPPERSEHAVDWLLWRQGVDLRWRSIDADEAWALDVCGDDADFGDICEGLADRIGAETAAFAAATYLKQWATDGLLASV